MRRQRIAKDEERTRFESFARTRRGPAAGMAESRAKALAVRVRQILSQYYTHLLTEESRRLKGEIKKAKSLSREKAIEALATAMTTAGVRVMEDAGKKIDPKFKVSDDIYQQYYDEKHRQHTMLIDRVTNEFRRKSREFVSNWLTEEPGLTHAEIARRLRFSYFADGGQVLKPGERPSKGTLRAMRRGPGVVRNIFGRASLLARTEMVEVQNTGIDTALRALGHRYKMWLSQKSDGGRGHQKMNNKIVPINEDFRLPDGTRMARPGRGPIGHVANCRCSIVAPPRSAVLREDKKRGINTAEADAASMFGSD